MTHWFQFSLKTAIVILVATGALLFLNFLHPEQPGWPIPFYVTERLVEPVNPSWAKDRSETGRWVDKSFLIADIVTAVLIVVFVALVCEYLIRRREGRKP